MTRDTPVSAGADPVTAIEWVRELIGISQEIRPDAPHEGYQRLLAFIVDGFRGCTGSLALVEGEGLRIAAGIGLPNHVLYSTVPFDKGVLGWVARRVEPLLIDGDLSRDDRFEGREERRESGTPRSSMCWPLKAGGELVGVLSVNAPESASPYDEKDLAAGSSVAAVLALVVKTARYHQVLVKRLDELDASYQSLSQANSALEQAHEQLLQSEKMASIGQLAAGVAHEINNPIGYIGANLNSLRRYSDSVFSLIDAYAAEEDALPQAARERLADAKDQADLEFLREDIGDVLDETNEGVGRVREIVKDLKDFAHPGEGDWVLVNLHDGLDKTLTLANNEIKYKADIVKEYGELPPVHCIAAQINQVFLNLIVNAAHAIDDRGTITIRSGAEADQVWVEVADTGAGIPEDARQRIFEPFYTTKPVGTGTGLGLAVSRGIVDRHQGRIEVRSAAGEGTTFRIWLPISSTETSEPAEG